MRYRHTPPVPNPARAPCPRGQARQAGVGIGSGLYRILLLSFLLSRPRADAFGQPASCIKHSKYSAIFISLVCARMQSQDLRVY